MAVPVVRRNSTTVGQIDCIKSSLIAKGMFATKHISDTLQGQIWSVIDAQTKQKYAVKTAAKRLYRKYDQKGIVDGNLVAIDENILKEAHILKYLRSLPKCPPSIIAYRSSFSSQDHYFLVMEHGGSSLFDLVQKAHYLLQTKKLHFANWLAVVRCVFKQMVQAAAFLHAHQVMHFDISIENFTLSEDPRISVLSAGTKNEKIRFLNVERDVQIKLIDFGLAERFVASDKENEQQDRFVSTKFAGKSNYQCPEIRQREPFDPAANDIWCMGVCLFMMVTGCMPWQVAEELDSRFKMIYVHRRLKQVLNVWNRAHYVDHFLLDLLHRIFRAQSDRISLARIQSHPWLSGHRSVMMKRIVIRYQH